MKYKTIECPDCETVVPEAATICACGYVFKKFTAENLPKKADIEKVVETEEQRLKRMQHGQQQLAKIKKMANSFKPKETRTPEQIHKDNEMKKVLLQMKIEAQERHKNTALDHMPVEIARKQDELKLKTGKLYDAEEVRIILLNKKKQDEEYERTSGM